MRPNLLSIVPALFLFLSVATAQDTPSANLREAAAETLSAEAVEASLEAVESGSADDLTKKALGDRYREALDWLTKEAEYRAREEDYRRALKTGTDETLRLRGELEVLSDSGASKLPAGLSEQSANEELEAALAREQGDLSLLKDEVRNLEGELLAIRDRPIELRERLIAAQGELKAATAALESAQATPDNTSPSQQAELTRLQARKQGLEAEIAMLEQEDASDDIRSSLAELARDLASARIDAGEKRVAAIRDLASARLTIQARRAEALVKKIQREVPDAPASLETREKELTSRTAEMKQVAKAIRTLETRHRDRDAERNRIVDAFASVKRQISIGGLEGTLAQLLLEQLKMLPSKQDSRQNLDEIQTELAEARRGFYELERAIVERSREDETSPLSTGPELAEFQEEIDALEASHQAVTADLKASYRRWIRELGTLEMTERQIAGDVQEFREFIGEKLFWVRSSRPIGTRHLGEIASGLNWCFGFNRFAELLRRLTELSPWFYLVVGAAFAALVVPRRRFRRLLREAGIKTRRISTDRYSHTLEAFLLSALLAAPTSFLLSTFGWALRGQPDASDWSFGLGQALLNSAWFLFQVEFVIALCRKDGLGEVHFRWDSDSLAWVRRLAGWLIPIYLPLVVTLTLVVSDSKVVFLDGLGRVTAVILIIGLGTIMALMMHPEKGVAALASRVVPRSIFGKLCRFWFYLILAAVLFLIVLLLSGFVFTGILLTIQVELTSTAILAAFVVYGMVLRWFSIRQRKLALDEALAERQARQEEAAAAADEPAETGADDAIIPEIQELEEMDLDTVGEQTRNLIGFLVGVGLLVALWFIWTKFAPILDGLDQWMTVGTFSVGDLAFSILVIAVMVETTRNLPGLLEVVILRRLNLDVGSRNAITTLSKYLVVGVGLLALFNRIGVDWSQFGWIAAALGVGIGFGLQEVVANFISGIILLFERPIRVGDVVTVDGVDGVVSRIQIRATTITNWDRKELIIPNKNFITGTVLNWTLSNAVNRILIVVGTAYGTDTEKARKILAEVAGDHPRILEDPPPLATFESFDDSSLRLLLRCYVPDMEGRVIVITELHTEIDKRFKEAGIEIAFPQQDLHLRSIDQGVSLGGTAKSADSK